MEIIVIIHNIRSLYNVGSIFRTADAAGVKKIYLCGITPAPIDIFGKLRQQLTNVSLGAEKSVEWEHIKSAVRLIDKLKKDNHKIFVIEQSENSIPYYKFQSYKVNPRKIVLVVGNEIKGIPASILRRADKILEIPMKGAIVRQAHHPRHLGRGKESLNVAVAFGIVVFHLINHSRINK